MSRQHRSSKLLNKATENNGKLTLYTELNHTFNVGDYVYISGGYYDNTTENAFTSNWLVSGSIFNTNNRPYKVISINVALNSFTLDYNVGLSPYFPYCSKNVITNIYADPTNLIDPAYITDDIATSGDNLYKHVYVSQVFNSSTRVRKGLINNGIFGTDVVLNYVGQKLGDGGNSSYKNNLTIRHIASKRIKMDYGVIMSKSFDTESTNKLEVNTTSGLYNLYNIVIANNNESQGYSYFQTAFIGSIYSNPYLDIELKLSKIGNGGFFYNTGVSITRALISGAYIGIDGVTKLDSNILEDCKIINNSILNNVKLIKGASSNYMEDSNHYSGYSLNLNSITSIIFDGTDTLTFNGTDPYIFISKKLDYSPTNIFYLSGIRSEDRTELVDYLNGEIRISNFSYTYGTNNSGIFDIQFLDLSTNTVDFIAKYTSGPGPFPGTYYVDNLILNDLFLTQAGINNDHSLTNVKLPYIYAINKTINITGSIVPDFSTPTGRPKLVTNAGSYNINLFAGYFKNIDINDNVIFYGNQAKTIIDLYQFTAELNNNTLFYNVIMKEDTTSGLVKRTYSGVFENSTINNGNYTNSSFKDTLIVKKGSTSSIFLYNSRISDLSYVDENVEWDYINFRPTRITYSLVGPYYIKNRHGYFQGRTTPFIIGNADQIYANNSALLATDYVWNLNNTKTTSLPFYPRVAYTPYTGNEFWDIVPYTIYNYTLDPVYNIKLSSTEKIVPNINPFQSTGISIVPAYPANTTVAVFNLGETIISGNNYVPIRNANYLITAENITTHPTLNNILLDTASNYFQPGTNGSGAVDTSLSITGTNPFTTRANSILTNTNYHKYKNTNYVNRALSIVSVGKLTVPNPATNFSQFTQTNFYAKGSTTNTLYPLTLNGTTILNETALAEGGYRIVYDNNSWTNMIGGIVATNVTGAYIEVETVITEKYDAIGGNIITAPYVSTYGNDPNICGPIQERISADLRHFMYDNTYPFAANPSLTSLKPSVSVLTVLPGEFYKITVNIAIYMYNLNTYTAKYRNCGKYELRQMYFWIQYT